MGFVPQIKDLLMVKDMHDNSLLAQATLSKNAVMFDAVLTFVEHHLSPHEVVRKSIRQELG